MSNQQKQSELQMERKLIHDTVERMKNREVNREQWLKMQAKCGTYLNKLNSLYKRNGSSPSMDDEPRDLNELASDPGM